jgi:hypothetical protein
MSRPALAALLASVALVLVAPADAQVQRVFPQNALRGALVIDNPPEITLNGDPARLAPGARIRGTTNMVEMSGGLTGARLLVHYTLDTSGLVKDVWILNEEEASRKPWPTTPKQLDEWIFDPVAQTWSKP